VAELYPPGIQRIYYKATISDNLVVTAKLLDFNLLDSSLYDFQKVPGTEKIYYADVDFCVEGIWLAIFYENGEEKTVQVYNTKKLPAEGEINFRGGFGGKGPSVINS